MQSRPRSPFEARLAEAQKRRTRLIQLGLIAAALLLAVLIIFIMNRTGTSTELSALRLTCYADQSVTPFGTNVLYYDGASIHCLAGNGAIRWSFPVGSNAQFHASNDHIVVWQGSQIYILDSNGRNSYNELLGQEIQFARISGNYAAVVLGGDTTPDLIVKDLQGTQVDEESEAFSSMLMLDVGFYGEGDQYMWTLCLDVYSTRINTVMNTFQVGKMNTGEVSLGDKLSYKVLFDNNHLKVFTTQQLYTYDYKAVLDASATMLIYGWKYQDAFHVPNHDGYILLTPTNLNNTSQTTSELRLLSGSTDRRYSLPTECFSAMVQNRSIYAFSNQYLYRVDIASSRSYAYASPFPDGAPMNAFLGKTSDGKALITSGSDVYIVTLPN